MKPTVFEDEVQMKMKIESTSVDSQHGQADPVVQPAHDDLGRAHKGRADYTDCGREPDHASRSASRGCPIIGLIPILGRFFATPETEDRQSDVVITVTPHILRRADIPEEDHLAREAGTLADPTTQLTIEQILYLADVEDAQPESGGVSAAGRPRRPGPGSEQDRPDRPVPDDADKRAAQSVIRRASW